MSRWEEATSRFINEEFQPALDHAREEVARFVGSSVPGFVFVRNATAAIAGVVRSLEASLVPGDEILTTGQAYNAVRQTLEFTAARTGARVVAVDVPLRLGDAAEVTGLVVQGVTERTRLAVVDHISSPTGQVFPVEEIIAALEPGVPVLVDGAHGPGQVPLDVGRLGASWYTGNLHKWVCAPKGAAFLSTRADRIAGTFPAIVSHGWTAPPGQARYRALFDWLGTDDPSPWLAAPKAIEVVGSSYPGGWQAVMDRNRDLALTGRRILHDALGVEAPYPDAMVGSMAALELPPDRGEASDAMLSPVMAELMRRGFETVVMYWPGWPSQVLRISAHLYNTEDEYRELASTLSEMFP